MKIVMNTLSNIQGIEIYPIITLLIFFTFFIVMAYFVFNLDKGYISDMKNMPLEEDENDSSINDMENNF